jgi:hypothetical protein
LLFIPTEIFLGQCEQKPFIFFIEFGRFQQLRAALPGAA